MKKHQYNTQYNPKRECYFSADGKYLCYTTLDLNTRRPVTLRYEIGKDGLTEELTFLIDDLYHQEELNERYETEFQDSAFNAEIANHLTTASVKSKLSPWEKIAVKGNSPEDILFKDAKPENPQVAEVRRVIDESCTEAQRDFYYDHFGKCLQLKEMCQAEFERTGNLPSSAAMTSRKNKIIEKAAKALGVERIKRHKYPKKEQP